METKIPRIEPKDPIPLMAIVGGIALFAGVALMPPPLRRGFEHAINKRLPNELLPPADLATLKKWGHIEDKEYKDELKSQGLNDTRANQLFQLTGRLLDISELTILKLRGEISEEEYLTKSAKIGLTEDNAQKIFKLTEKRLDPDSVTRAWLRDLPLWDGLKDYYDELKEQGWSEERIGTIKALAEIMPPPGDIITWAAREVFEPELRTLFRLDEGLPPSYLEWAKKVGITGEVAKNYWAAHWVLPSILQIYEMWHRGVIEESIVDSFFVQLDMCPYWRDKLKAISFRVFTRVDVRRMNKIGTLDEEGVKRAYLDLGYDEEKADKMTEFTLKYNADPEDAEMTAEEKRKEELKGLTRAAILKQYREQMLEKSAAGDYLAGLGYSTEVIDFYLAREDYLREEEKVDGYIKSYHRLYVNDIVDYNELVDLFGKLNLPDTNVQYLTELWDLEKLQKPSQPSKADLVRFTKKGIISLETFKKKMAALGYSLKYIGWYIKDYELAAAKT